MNLSAETIATARSKSGLNDEDFEQVLIDARQYITNYRGCSHACYEPCSFVADGRTRECNNCMECCVCEPDEDGDILDCECQIDHQCEWMQGRDTRSCAECDECDDGSYESCHTEFDFLGSGVYHVALRHTSGLVVKFGGIKYEQDSTSYQYALTCMENIGMTFVPDVYHAEETCSGEYFMVTKFYEGIYETCIDVDHAPVVIGAIEAERRTGTVTRHTINSGIYGRSCGDTYDRMFECDAEQLQRYIEDAIKFSRLLPIYGSLDLHDQNYMVCPDVGELVITDPLC